MNYSAITKEKKRKWRGKKVRKSKMEIGAREQKETRKKRMKHGKRERNMEKEKHGKIERHGKREGITER